MKQVSCIIAIIVFLVSFVCSARNAQELFLRANKCYERNEWQKAVDTYDAIGRKGRAVWYNMGNCLYKLHQYPDALVCWKRAQKGATAAESYDITRNIHAAVCKLGKTEHDTWWERWYNFIQRGAGFFSLLTLQLIFLLAWFLLFFGARWWVKQRWYFSQALLLVVGVLFSGTSLFVVYRAHQYPVGIVLKKRVSLFAGPNQDYHVLDTVHCADEVKICEEHPGWYKVLCHGTLGWIAAADVKVV